MSSLLFKPPAAPAKMRSTLVALGPSACASRWRLRLWSACWLETSLASASYDFSGQTLACEGLACEGLSRSSRGLRTRLGVERDGAARLNAVCSPSGASLYPHSRHELLRLGTSRGQECPQPHWRITGGFTMPFTSRMPLTRLYRQITYYLRITSRKPSLYGRWAC